MARRRWVAAVLLAVGVAGLAYRRGSLSGGGALMARLVGALTFGRGGPPAAAALLAFFVSSSGLSRLREGSARAAGALPQAKGGRRDAWQVLANGGVAAACLVGSVERWQAGFLGALAAAAADTWGTELGLLAGQAPRLITSLQRVPRGTSGGVTPAGLLAGVGGAALVSAAWRASGGPSAPARAAPVAGVAGTLLDSLLGATLQALYYCERCGVPTERAQHTCGNATMLTRGFGWMTNDTVNALATLGGAGVGACLTR